MLKSSSKRLKIMCKMQLWRVVVVVDVVLLLLFLKRNHSYKFHVIRSEIIYHEILRCKNDLKLQPTHAKFMSFVLYIYIYIS